MRRVSHTLVLSMAMNTAVMLMMELTALGRLWLIICRKVSVSLV